MQPRSGTTGPQRRLENGGPKRDPACRLKRFAEFRRSVPAVAQDRMHQLRRSGRADRHDAPHGRRREEMARRAALPACAELLHAAAGAGGAKARDLHRLGAARRARRPGGRHPVCAAGRAVHARPEPALRARARRPVDRRRAVRHQGGRAGDRDRSAAAHRQARAEDAAALRARGRGLRRDLLSQRAISGHRRACGADRLSGGAPRAGAGRAEERGDRHRARRSEPLAPVLSRCRSSA